MARLPEIKAKELIQNTGVIKPGNTGEGLADLGKGLGAFGVRLRDEEEKDRIASAAIEGDNAVGLDEGGNITVQPFDTSGAAGRARAARAQVKYESLFETQTRTWVSEQVAGHRGDPDGFNAAMGGFRAGTLENVPEAYRGRAEAILQANIDRGYTTLLTQATNQNDRLSAASWDASLKSLMGDMSTLASAGHFNTPTYNQKAAEFEKKLQDGVASGLIDKDMANQYRTQIQDEGTGQNLARDALVSYQRAGGGIEGRKAAEKRLNEMLDNPNLGIDQVRRERIAGIARARISREEGLRNDQLRILKDEANDIETRIQLGRPVDPAATLGIANKAAALGDTAYAKYLRDGLSLQSDVQAFAKLPLADQQTTLRRVEAEANDPKSGAVGAIRARAFEQAHNAKRNALSKDAFGYGVVAHRDWIGQVPDLDFSKPQEMAQALKTRAMQADKIGAVERVGVLPMTTEELGRFSNAINVGNASQNAKLLAALTDGLGARHMPNVLAAIRGGSKKASAFAAAAGLSFRDEQLGGDILFGMGQKEANNDLLPTNDSGLRKVLGDYFGNALAYSAPGSQAMMYEAALSLYAKASAEAGDFSKTINTQRMKDALNRVTGGMISYNGRKIVTPQPGMGQPEFDALIGGLTDADILPEFTPEGRRVNTGSGGEVFTEKTITVTDPKINNGRATNIPSVFGGKQVDEAEAIARVSGAGGRDPETGWILPSFDSIDAAVDAAKKRSSSLGAMLFPRAADGSPIGAEAIRRNGTLYSVGDGKYQVTIGGFAVPDPVDPRRGWIIDLSKAPIRKMVAPDVQSPDDAID